MQIVTFNVNGIRARLPALLGYLADASPDVVCLQELKCAEEHFPTTALSDAGYGAIWPETLEGRCYPRSRHCSDGTAPRSPKCCWAVMRPQSLQATTTSYRVRRLCSGTMD